MSPYGAMIESAFVPIIGSSVSIRRGRLLVTGQVVWAKGGRFGLSFSHPTEVRDWLLAPKNPVQLAADGAFWVLGVDEVDPDAGFSGERANSGQTNPLAEIGEVIRLMAELGDRLAEDLTVVGQHGQVLQNLDAAMQILQRIPADCAVGAR